MYFFDKVETIPANVDIQSTLDFLTVGTNKYEVNLLKDTRLGSIHTSYDQIRKIIKMRRMKSNNNHTFHMHLKKMDTSPFKFISSFEMCG